MFSQRRPPTDPAGHGRATLLAALLSVGAAGCAGTGGTVDGDPWRAAEAATAAEDWPAAAAHWHELALAHGDREPAPFLETARALRELGDAESATALLDQAIALHPDEADLFALRALLLEEQGYARAAEADYLAATERDATRSAWWLGLGRVRLVLAAPMAAQEPLRRAVDLGAPGVDPPLLLARAHRAAGQHGQAGEAYLAALSRAPGEDLDLFVEVASLLTEDDLATTRPDECTRALDLLATVVARDPQHASAHFVRGVLLERCGDEPGAVTSYRRAVEVDNFHLDALTNLAVLYARQGDRAAKEFATRALDLEPSAARRRALEGLVASVD